jgi:hypothetical protein
MGPMTRWAPTGGSALLTAGFGIDNLGYKPMLMIAAIKPQISQSLEAPVLTGRRLTFNPRR